MCDQQYTFGFIITYTSESKFSTSSEQKPTSQEMGLMDIFIRDIGKCMWPVNRDRQIERVR